MTDEKKTNAPAIKNANGGLMADMASALMAGIAASPLQNIGNGGKPFLRMGKDGLFTFGPESEEVDPNSEWAVNPMTFQHGWVCWVEGARGSKPRKIEMMVSMTQPMPPEPDPVEDQAFTHQGAFELRGCSADVEGVEIVFVTNSNGGLQAVRSLTDAFQRHYPIDPSRPCPIVTMASVYYMHPTYGKIYKPVFDVIDWCDMNGRRTHDPALAPRSSEPVPAPTPEPVPTAQARLGQRRRPATVHQQ